ncbi:NHL repeat-containing protein [Candidatus Bipolaricaulota bacterium]
MKRKVSFWVCALLIGGLLGSVPIYAEMDLEFVGEWYVEGSPAWVAVHDPSGEVFVNINHNWRVVKYSANGDVLLEFGREGEIPVGIAVDQEGNSVVAVNINHNWRVVKYSPDGEVLGEWEGEGEPRGIALDPEGNSVVAVNINHNYRVVKYSPDGEVLAEWEGEGEPTAIAVDAEGNSVVAVNINHNWRLVKYSADGELITSWHVVAGVIETSGITVGPGGEVFVTINSNHRVVAYSAEGGPLGEFGSQGSAPGQFLYPQGIAMTSAGLIYIADSGNNRIQAILWDVWEEDPPDSAP